MSFDVTAVGTERAEMPPTEDSASLRSSIDGFPIWIRPPKSGSEFYSGLSRAKLYELAAKGLIRSVSLRESGQQKGTRLFHLQSIIDFIEQEEAKAK